MTMEWPIRPPRTAAEREALWDAATDTDNPCTEAERGRMFRAMLVSDIAYICGHLPASYLPPV